MDRLAERVRLLVPAANLEQTVRLQDDGNGAYIAFWDTAALGAQPTQAALEAVALPSALQMAKDRKIAALYAQADALLTAHNYAPGIRAGFAALLSEARNEGKTNRAVYCRAVLDWGISVINEYETKKAAVNALTVVVDVDGFTWDTATLAGQDPLKTLAGALAITN